VSTQIFYVITSKTVLVVDSMGQILVGLGNFWEYFGQNILLFNIFLFIYGKLSVLPIVWEALGEFGRLWESFWESMGGIPNLTYQNVTQWHYSA